MQLAFPRWKYIILIVSIIVGILYSLPNLFGEDPSIQIVGKHFSADQYQILARDVTKVLTDQDFTYKTIDIDNNDILIRFTNTETQLKAQGVLQQRLGDGFSVALNLAPVTPKWLSAIGAHPMKLGLDLRGGVRFLMEVDVKSSIKRRLDNYYSEIRNELRNDKIHYQNLILKPDNTIALKFADKAAAQDAIKLLNRKLPEFLIDAVNAGDAAAQELSLSLTPAKITELRNNIIDQTMVTLRNRVNELGVAEDLVQRQGLNRIVVELPGIQDTARAKDILGKTATLDFVLVDDSAIKAGIGQGVGAGGGILIKSPETRILLDRYNRPITVKKKVLLTGESIVGASSAFDSEDSQPIVSVKLGGGGVAQFSNVTRENIGKPMAVIYRETKTEAKIVNGVIERIPSVKESIISVAVIQSQLGANFKISGLALGESRDLALLLRSGALPAAVSIVEESVIGPSMGQDNINKGMISVAVGLGLVIVFMTLYYRFFGIIANLALLMNLVLLVAVVSLIGTTLTLPAIAGIVLTLGMAVDANVLIFERIREELRLGMTPLGSIERGFERAFATIVDSNITTLVVGIILFAVGTGPVKGFAITLSLGILTSMFTAITGTKAITNLCYSGKNVKKLSIGI